MSAILPLLLPLMVLAGGVSPREAERRTRPCYAVDPLRCRRCGACARICPAGAILIGPGGGPEFDFTLCGACGKCAERCRSRAIYRERTLSY